MKCGRTMSWSVEAYDAQDRQIGVGVEHERAFVVAKELADQPAKQEP
jgi:hypothetical protein